MVGQNSRLFCLSKAQHCLRFSNGLYSLSNILCLFHQQLSVTSFPKRLPTPSPSTSSVLSFPKRFFHSSRRKLVTKVDPLNELLRLNAAEQQNRDRLAKEERENKDILIREERRHYESKIDQQLAEYQQLDKVKQELNTKVLAIQRELAEILEKAALIEGTLGVRTMVEIVARVYGLHMQPSGTGGWAGNKKIGAAAVLKAIMSGALDHFSFISWADARTRAITALSPSGHFPASDIDSYMLHLYHEVSKHQHGQEKNKSDGPVIIRVDDHTLEETIAVFSLLIFARHLFLHLEYQDLKGNVIYAV
ncbi:hypothetical protein C8J56DRAFT_1057372 [Mycena floridula]|nr:hypothetical protein C8J56DRAFT_1057372 [Mycena floridula]